MCVKLSSGDLNLGPYSPHIVEWPMYQICAVVNGIFSNGNGNIKFFLIFLRNQTGSLEQPGLY